MFHEPILINEIHFFRILVNDLSESVTWYTERLGFTLRHNDSKLALMSLESCPLFVWPNRIKIPGGISR
ncbi:VOC family protein [Pseudalkalibacillus sp. A8]|uniref:VOC family protein n=1 Tax=Pseudalkalibacillus sp. A8 TaxID=3382641 RepID=UPI0038B4FBB3